jgi:CheY-like chemotaxis protein
LNATAHNLDVPLVIGVTSHRNMAANEIEPVRERIREFLAQLKRDYPGLPLVMLSALAEGGDQLAAREALAAGARLIAPLPLPPQTYAEDFLDPAIHADFSELCERAEVLQMPLLPGNTPASVAVHGEGRDRQYAQAGVYIASHCHILLALWDGRESDLLGGTAQVVRYALDGVMPGLIERRRSARATLANVDESIVLHIVCSRADSNGAVQAPAPGLAPLQVRWLSQKQARPVEAGMPDEFRRMFARMAEFDSDQERNADEILAGAAGSGIDIGDDNAGDALDRLFVAADTLAIHFQKRVLLMLRSIHVLAALTGVAFVAYSDLPADVPYQFYGIYVFIALFAIGGLLAWLARQRDWHRKYIDYRALAEGLRVQRYWRQAGVATSSSSAFAHDNFMQKKDVELGWIRNVMRVASMDRIEAAPADEHAINAVISEWIGAPGHGGQLDYYTRKTAHRSQMQRVTRGLGQACLWAGIAIVIFLALFQAWIGPEVTNLLVAVMAVLGIIAAARESYAYRKGDKELMKQYRYMLGVFADARGKLDASTDVNSKRDILRALGDAALAEHSEWALMHRERPLENARF